MADGGRTADAQPTHADAAEPGQADETGGAARAATAVRPITAVMSPVTRTLLRRKPPKRSARSAIWLRPPDAAGVLLARLTVLPVVLLLAWLIPGVPLLLAHDFEPAPMLLISVPLAVVLVVAGLRVVPAGWTRWFGLLATVALVAGLTTWQLIDNSQALIVVRDPGTYLQTGYWIAQHGSLPIPEPLTAFGGAHPGLHFASTGFLT